MNSKLPNVIIFITVATWAGFAVWLGVIPSALLTTFGVEVRTPQMLTEVRAFYGGVEMAIAVAMIWLWRRGDLFAALLIGGLPLAGSAIGRCVGLMVDGFSGLHAGFAGMETLGAAVCFAGCQMVSRGSRNE